MARKRQFPKITLDAAIFDIETMDFSAGGVVDHLICVSILPLDQPEPATYRLNFADNGNDVRLLKEIIDALNTFDILIGHNIAAFDLNWLTSRALYHGLSIDKRFLYYDTYQAARRMAIKADRKSLAFLADFLRVPFTKTAVHPVSWSHVASRDKDEFEEAMNDIIYHCEQDVLANREIFNAIYPRDKSSTSLPFYRK